MKLMTDKQFKEAIEKLGNKKPVIRGGRSEAVIPDKKKSENKKACRKKIK